MQACCLTPVCLASTQVMQLQQGFADAENRVQELEASEARLKARVGDLERAEEVLHLVPLVTCGVPGHWLRKLWWQGMLPVPRPLAKR